MYELPRRFKRQLRAQRYVNLHPPEDLKMETYVNDAGERVTARQVTQDSITILSVWSGAQVVAEHDALDHGTTFQALNVPTTDGPMRASQGDYVVRHGDGSFHVQKAYQFRSKYREV